jgi:tetratricopeptide (TPR) repeat protein
MVKSEEAFLKSYDAGWDFLKKRKPKQAKKAYLKAIEDYQHRNDVMMMASVHDDVAMKFLHEGFREDGLVFIKEALRRTSDEGFKKGGHANTLLSSIGGTASAYGLKKEAERCFNTALENVLKMGWPSNKDEILQSVLCNMASAGFKEKALEHAPECKDDRERFFIYSCIIIAYAKNGEFDKAIGLSPKLKLPDTMVNRMATDERIIGRTSLVWNTIAEEQAKRGLKEEAKKSFSKSVDTVLDAESALSRTWDLIFAADKMCEAGFRKEANDAFEKAMEASKEDGNYVWMIGMWEDIQKRQEKFGYKREAAKTARMITEAMKNPKAYGYKEKKPIEEKVSSRIVDFALIFALIIMMYLAVSNFSLINAYLSSDLAFVLIFIVPFIYAALLAYIQTDLILTILKGWGTILVLYVAPLFLPLLMLVLMLGLLPSLSSIMADLDVGTVTLIALFTLLPIAIIAIDVSINRLIYGQKAEISEQERNLLKTVNLVALIAVLVSILGMLFLVGSNSSGLMESVKATALLFLILPFAINLYVIGDLMINRSSHYSGIMIIFLPVLYLVFAIIGALLGAVGFLILG